MNSEGLFGGYIYSAIKVEHTKRCLPIFNAGNILPNELCPEKTCLQGFQPSKTQIRLNIYRRWPKTKALIILHISIADLFLPFWAEFWHICKNDVS